MSIPKYSKYKNSGVDRIGEVPNHWLVRKIQDAAAAVPQAIVDGPFGSDLKNEEYAETGVPLIQLNNISPGVHVVDNLKFVTSDKARSLARHQAKPGDVVIAKMADPVARAAVVDDTYESYVIVADCIRLTVGPDFEPGYLQYWLNSDECRSIAESLASGITRLRINLGVVKKLPLPTPTLREQKAISAFLDHETARIDALITEQERLIELLQEKRQAVISHTVTKGLDPNVAMKPSGIGWLGEVPEHWAMKRLKHISPAITVGIVVEPSSYISETGLPFIYGGDIREGVIDWESARRISVPDSEANTKTLLQEGDLLTVRVGAPGVTAVVPSECAGGNCASVVLIRRGAYSSDWLCYVMNARVVRYQVELVQYGAAQEQFNVSHAVNFWLPCPPQHEQIEIAAYLCELCARMEPLISTASRAIALLQERRSALISAAVTGQIDVRGLVPETAA